MVILSQLTTGLVVSQDDVEGVGDGGGGGGGDCDDDKCTSQRRSDLFRVPMRISVFCGLYIFRCVFVKSAEQSPSHNCAIDRRKAIFSAG